MGGPGAASTEVAASVLLVQSQARLTSDPERDARTLRRGRTLAVTSRLRRPHSGAPPVGDPVAQAQRQARVVHRAFSLPPAAGTSSPVSAMAPSGPSSQSSSPEVPQHRHVPRAGCVGQHEAFVRRHTCRLRRHPCRRAQAPTSRPADHRHAAQGRDRGKTACSNKYQMASARLPTVSGADRLRLHRLARQRAPDPGTRYGRLPRGPAQHRARRRHELALLMHTCLRY